MFTNYQQALNYLHQSIPKGSLRYPGELGLKRQFFLLDCLDNPQNKYPIIHLAGTSGKGSTASYISLLLASQGFKVGLTVSPHIFDIKERIQINNKNISQKDFVFLLNKIIPAVQKTKENGLGNPTYFEIMVTMFYFAFYYFKVDYAVIETGMGGLMDGTNVVSSQNKIAVITRLGLDHTRILGKNIKEISIQKAGIIHPKNIVISPWQVKNARQVLDASAKQNNSPIFYVKKGINYKNIHLKNDSLIYNFNFNNFVLKNIKLNTHALYQVENSATSLAVLKTISQRDNFEINHQKIKKTLSKFSFNGRMNIVHKNLSTIIFDGAHNPQKMSAFIKSLKFSYPLQKFIFIIAFKQKKEAKRMLQKVIPIANKIILTSFIVEDQDMAAISQSIKNLTKILDQLKFKNYQIINNPNQAIEKSLKESRFIAITGSLYLISKVKSYF